MAEIRQEIMGSLNDKRNNDKFFGLRERVFEFENQIKDNNLRLLFHNCFFNTIDSASIFEEDGSVFILTGDIPAMWLRDSSAQVMQYLFFANNDIEVQSYIKGVLKKQFNYIMIDPYANAFNRTENGMGHIDDLPKQSGWVWERKFELDSLCYPLFLACCYYENTNDKSCFDNLFINAFDKIIEIFKIEQNHKQNSKYYHVILDSEKCVGYYGAEVKNNGLVWSGYRPSDDLCKYGYYIPGNMFIVSVLTKLNNIFNNILNDDIRSEICENFANEIQNTLKKTSTVNIVGVGEVYALETDGFDNFNIMDDANIPNLLSMPYYEYPYIDKKIYENTRKYMLSTKNPFYYVGSKLVGIGSPHTPKDRVWPLSIIIQALTSDDKEEINKCVSMLKDSTNDTFYIHEAIDKDDCSKYSRPWFAWANSLFSYMILKKKDLIDFEK